MKARRKGLDQRKFGRVRNAKSLIVGLLLTSVTILSAFLVIGGGYSGIPLFIPLDRALNILIITVVAISILNMVFRALEVRYAPKQGQKLLLAESSWRGAKRALGIGLVLALFFAIPATQALVTNVLSQTDSRSVDVGESFPLSFTNQDPLGITKTAELRVSVQNGALMVRVSNGTRIINPGGTSIVEGDQESIPLSTASFITYSVTFENVANGTTLFSYRVDTGFPPGFTALVFLMSSMVAASNLVWLLFLKRLKTNMPRPTPTPRPVGVQPAPPRQRIPSPSPTSRTSPTIRPWWQLQRMYGVARERGGEQSRVPQRRVPAKKESEAPRGKSGMEREVPPPPSHVEPYDVEAPPPPMDGGREGEPTDDLREFALDISTLLDKAEERVSSGEYQEALEDYETVLLYDRRNLRALLSKAELLRRLQRTAEAIEHLDRALRLDHWQHRALVIKGQLLEEEGRFDEALECYETILRGGPEYVEALLRKGDIMARMNESELAMEAYQEALRLSPGDPEIEERITALEEERADPLDRAVREAATGDDKAAEELFQRALEGEHPGEARKGLIDLYMQTGREEEALNLLDEAIAAEPENLDLILRRVKALSKRGRLADALVACEAACDVAPDEASVWAIRGALEADLGLGTRAAESLERTLHLDPRDVESVRRLDDLRQRGDERVDLEAAVQGIQGVPSKAVKAILKAYHSLKELKAAKVKALASLDGVSETAAKKVLRAIRKGG